MSDPTHYPLVLFALSFVVLSLSAAIERSLLGKQGKLDREIRDHFGVILAATLTLLGLIIGFSFSMAISRYDLRKTYEEAEANAIGTEYVRADLLPSADAVNIRQLLRSYVDQRILFYVTHDEAPLREVNTRTAKLQAELWSAVRPPAAANPTAIVALAVAGMNDVLNSQGYTQAAMWNRIPTAAWTLMLIIAICCNVLLGYGLRGAAGGARLLVVVPFFVSIAFMLIADIDTPRHGIIRVNPQNLMSLAASLHAH
jgi:hypothetical protein